MKNFMFFLVIHLFVFCCLLYRDIRNDRIKTAAKEFDYNSMTPFAIIVTDFFWEMMAVLYVLFFGIYFLSMPGTWINNYFKKKYK